ncbi:MAG: hypothetical protein GX908_07525 [Gammaproteobacteria bacterium]|nr:hypothetical protein [Gammaproteobacteria bacterium]
MFLGDFIDRGPKQAQTIKIVQDMIENGHAQAVMGNHEFNAIAWATEDSQNSGAFLRARTQKTCASTKRFYVKWVLTRARTARPLTGLKRSLAKLYLQTYSPATMILNRCLLAITG